MEDADKLVGKKIRKLTIKMAAYDQISAATLEGHTSFINSLRALNEEIIDSVD